ncbi:DUF4097 family beta strand repeat-containing protein [Sphaerisporangium aureirubrum]|uniref:Adhesin domain-containing protein n=1 Tax=Sphaerisporangium aureirubrum TaxID=1544736 RepID=A0ABW1NQC2_9ACTN
MPTFRTPEPIKAEITLAVGEVAIIAGDRDDTVVTVAPYDPELPLDVKAAREVDVSYTADGLRIRQGHPWRHRYGRDSAPGTVSITVELPSGSEVRGKAYLGTIRGEGLLGRCRFTAYSGQLQLAAVGGDLRARSNNGSILVQRADANVDARTKVGNIVVGEVLRGTVDLVTQVGEVEVGVHPDSTADLNARSRLGRVRNTLPAGRRPASAAATVRIRARTSLDDIIIRRS